MGNNSSRLQPSGSNYAQNLLFRPDYQDALKRAQAAGYNYNYPSTYPQAQPIYSNGYVLQYPTGYPQAMYQQPQGVQYYMQQPQMTMQQPQMVMQPQQQMPQPQVQAQQMPQQQPVVIPQMIQPQQPQMVAMPQPTPTPAPGIPQAQYPGRYSPAPPPHPPQENPDPRVPSPFPPAPADAFGPPGPRPLTPIPNPLPSPPKDVYELEPYKSMLSRDLTGTWTPPPRAPGAPGDSDSSGSDGGGGRRRRRRNFFGSLTGRRDGDGEGGRRRGGLFRSWTTRRRDGDRYEISPPAAVMDGPFPPVVPSPAPGYSRFTPNTTPMPMPTPVVPQSGSPSTLEPVRFNMLTGHDGFLPHSPHTVLYGGELYPSAFHLFEALKFLRNGRHDIAAQIRTTENPADVHPLSERMKEFAKAGFERELMEYMDEALYAKFTQHPQLRELLLNTGVADLIYAEATDPVWGEGRLGQGMNHLGIALRRLRERLRAEMAER